MERKKCKVYKESAIIWRGLVQMEDNQVKIFLILLWWETIISYSLIFLLLMLTPL